MRENRSLGSVRGAVGNSRPYRDTGLGAPEDTRSSCRDGEAPAPSLRSGAAPRSFDPAIAPPPASAGRGLSTSRHPAGGSSPPL